MPPAAYLEMIMTTSGKRFSTSRRNFLKMSGIGLAGGTFGTLAAALGPKKALAKPASITLMQESSFIKAYDDYMIKVLAPAYEKETGIKMVFNPVSVGTLPSQIAAALAGKSGADLSTQIFYMPTLYNEELVDVSDIAHEVGRAHGGWYKSVEDAVVVNGHWKAIPFGNVGQVSVYRTDWFEEAGIKDFPDTWDEFLEAGTKLKRAGHPFGLELGHGFGDNHGWLYPLLWSYGAQETTADGKHVVLDSDETAHCVDFVRKLYKDALLEDCLGWTDPSNNKAFLSQQISMTNNAASILWVAKRDMPDLAARIGHAPNPRGPKGRFHLLDHWSRVIYKYSPDHEADKQFLRWLMQEKQLYGMYSAADSYYAPFLHGFDKAKFWYTDPRWAVYRDTLSTAHLPGWPGPVTRENAEWVFKWVVIDMFASACAGKSTRDVIKQATKQIKQIRGEA